MNSRLTAKQIHDDARRRDMPTKSARMALRAARDAITALLQAKTDIERARIFNKFQKPFLGFGRLPLLATWSALARPTERLLRARAKQQAAEARREEIVAQEIVARARVLRQRTGLPEKLAACIARRAYCHKAMHPRWPVRVEGDVQVAVGPRGPMPLSGPGSPWDVLEQRGHYQGRIHRKTVSK